MEKILEEIGFSKSEAKVYVVLLGLGETKSGEIIKKTSLQSSVVHNALNTLTDKGFVTHILKGKIKHYSALKPKLIDDYLKNKRQNFLNILPQLELMQKESKNEKISVEIFEGYNGLYAAQLNLLQDAKKGDIHKYFTGESSLLSKEAIDFFKKLDKLRNEKGVKIFGIAKNEKSMLNNYTESRIRFTDQSIPPSMNIFKDKIIIFILSDKPLAILIKSNQIAKQYHSLWDEIWKNAK